VRFLGFSQKNKGRHISRLLRVEVSVFVLSPEIETETKSRLATGRSTKRPSTLNDEFFNLIHILPSSSRFNTISSKYY
jgi:hypothetical protein